MSSTHTENFENAENTTDTNKVLERIAINNKNHNDKYMPVKLAQAIANSIFPELDSLLRSGRHIGSNELDRHAFLVDFQTELEQFYHRYNVELIRAPEDFFYLRPRSTTLIPRSVLSELDMLVGKVLCYLYLSPERLAHEGIFTLQELFDEITELADESKVLRLVNQRSTGSDLDRQKLFDKVKTSLNRLRRLSMVYFLIGNASSRFRINESIFRFGADVRTGDDAQESQLRLIRDGEAINIETSLKLDDDEYNKDELEDKVDEEIE